LVQQKKASASCSFTIFINISRIATAGDELVALMMSEGFPGVGDWYQDFGQTRDEEIGERPSYEDL
jgi:hypothetical protein